MFSKFDNQSSLERISPSLTVKKLKSDLALFDGYDGRAWLDSVELYNTQTEKWETTNIKLRKAKACFSFLTVKLGDILSKLH